MNSIAGRLQLTALAACGQVCCNRPPARTASTSYGSITLTTVKLRASPDSVAQGAELLRAGRLVAFPTETVYGLGAAATNERAVAALFNAKGRPANNPLIVHLAGIKDAARLVRFDALSRKAADLFWPGPLTLVLPLLPDSGVTRLVTSGRRTLAVRVPSHPVARELITVAGLPVAAPSANISGRVSPTTADHVMSDLVGRVDAIIDAGPCTHGLESTVIRPTVRGPELLRPGALTKELLEERLGVEFVVNSEPAEVVSPGQLPSHYSPKSRVRMNAASPSEGEVHLGFGPDGCVEEFSLSPVGNLTEAAARFYDLLRKADEHALRSDASTIAISPIPETGLGRALNDRLRRASLPQSG